MDGPICRYRSPAGHIVDVLASRPKVQGFSGRWFPGAVEHVIHRPLANGVSILVPECLWLLACKIEAYHDRGAKDPLVSNDFEDIVAILDGRAALEAEVAAADAEVRRFLADWCATVLGNDDLREAAEGHLPRGGDDTDRRRRLRGRLTSVDGLGS
jgi:hypothetical protein